MVEGFRCWKKRVLLNRIEMIGNGVEVLIEKREKKKEK